MMLRVYAFGDGATLEIDCRTVIGPFNACLLEHKSWDEGLVEFTIVVPGRTSKACRAALVGRGFSLSVDDVCRGDVVLGSRRITLDRSVLEIVFKRAEISLTETSLSSTMTSTEIRALTACRDVLGTTTLEILP